MPHIAADQQHRKTPQAYGEDDYLIFDCPGQVELYSHLSVFQSFVQYMTRNGWCVPRWYVALLSRTASVDARFVCCVYCLDAQFLSEPTKLLAGTLQAMSAMVLLETPHVNVMTKADLVQDPVRGCCCCTSATHNHMRLP